MDNYKTVDEQIMNTITNDSKNVEKDIIRQIYQKMVHTMNLLPQLIDLSENELDLPEFYKIKYQEIIDMIHLNMLDIPQNIYEGLMKIVSYYFSYEFELGYGNVHSLVNQWMGCLYGEGEGAERLKGLDSNYLETLEDEEKKDLFIERTEKEFYSDVRKVLDQYIAK